MFIVEGTLSAQPTSVVDNGPYEVDFRKQLEDQPSAEEVQALFHDELLDGYELASAQTLVWEQRYLPHSKLHWFSFGTIAACYKFTPGDGWQKMEAVGWRQTRGLSTKERQPTSHGEAVWVEGGLPLTQPTF